MYKSKEFSLYFCNANYIFIIKFSFKMNLGIIIFLFFVVFLEAKKDLSNLLPDHISPELFCVACTVVAVETVKILQGRKGESDVYHALSTVCNQEYKEYRNKKFKLVFHHREISEACQTFRDIYDDDKLEEFFQKRGNDERINYRLCIEKLNVVLYLKLGM